jgi:hypothetical protein
VESDFAAALSAGHGLELLTKHGIATFAKFFAGLLKGTSGAHVCNVIIQSYADLSIRHTRADMYVIGVQYCRHNYRAAWWLSLRSIQSL